MDPFAWLFDTAGFPARWQCGDWSSAVGWLHIVADMLIFAAYTAIPLVIAFYVFKRRDVQFPPLYWLFSAFIFSCGTTHLVEAVIFYQPVYHLSGVLKAITAVVSLAAVGMLCLVTPRALSLPGLASLSEQLQREVRAHQEAERELARKNAELAERSAELERSNEELEQYASMASHDLQEPLRKVRFYASCLQDEDEGYLSPDGIDHLHRMGEAVDRMQKLIQDLLTYSRMGQGEVHADWIDLRPVVERCWQALRADADEAELVVEGPLPRLLADEVQLEQLFANLFGNACKYRDEERPLRVEVSAQAELAGGATIRVEDNGIGFDPAHAERILKPFERLHSRHRYPGTGIGLALCRRIVERLGGDLIAEGEEGVGARFLIRLPAAAVDTAGPATESGAQP